MCPGALPLLQYTLTELFESRRGDRITLAAYQQLGGISSALARRDYDLLVVHEPEGGMRHEALRQAHAARTILQPGQEGGAVGRRDILASATASWRVTDRIAVKLGARVPLWSRAGAAEFVVEDGVTGVLTPPGDVDALAAALEPLMRDPALAVTMGQRARARVEEKFSLDAEASAIADVYRRLI